MSDFLTEVTVGLTQGRALAEARMDSTCRVFYLSERGALNPTTRKQEPTEVDRATGVPCRVGAAGESTNASTTAPADALGAKVMREISVPVDSETFYVGDFIELTTIGSLTDPALEGVRFRIVDPGTYSQGTARRLKVEVDL